jgi:glycerol-1-phosphate dehydrogenase [NAD(P)+]
MGSAPQHYMQLPREIFIGRGVLAQLITICKSLGFQSSIFVVTGPNVYSIITKGIIERLTVEDYQVNHFFVPSSSVQIMEGVIEYLKHCPCEVVLGVGGGTVIDVAKISASRIEKPFISIPTAASHDGIASSRASVKGLDKPTSISTTAPLAVLADTEVILQSPYQLTAAGCGDIISKYTAVYDWELGHRCTNEYYGEYSANLALMSARLIMKNAVTIAKNIEEGLRIVLEALISCGVAMSIAGSSRPCSGAEHMFSHALDTIADTPALHGEQCGIGAILMAYLQHRNWQKIREKLQIIGVPITAHDMGIKDRYIIEALLQAHTIRPHRFTILGRDGLTRKTAIEAAMTTGVIS